MKFKGVLKDDPDFVFGFTPRFDEDAVNEQSAQQNRVRNMAIHNQLIAADDEVEWEPCNDGATATLKQLQAQPRKREKIK